MIGTRVHKKGKASCLVLCGEVKRSKEKRDKWTTMGKAKKWGTKQ